jgi:hypothetical protein
MFDEQKKKIANALKKKIKVCQILEMVWYAASLAAMYFLPH